MYVFKDDDYIPALYKLEMGNVYALIDRTYLSIGNIDKCLDYLEQMVDVEIYHNEVEVEKLVIKNKYLNKANIYNYSNYRAFDKDCDILCSLDLQCFYSVKDNEKYKKILEKAHKYLK